MPDTATSIGLDRMPTVTAPGPALVVRGLRKAYGMRAALREVDLVVHGGELVAVTGPPGAGKSTLLRVVAGLDRADAGSVALAGIRTETLDGSRSARVRRRHVGLVSGSVPLIEQLSVLENVALAALVAGARAAAATARARDLLDSMGLLGCARDTPEVLSEGQRQRVSIARALANRPTVLLADEPAGTLDPACAAQVLELFGRLHAAGQTIVLATRGFDGPAGAARVVRMRDGRVEP